MTDLDLYKFINNNSIEWHRQDNDGIPDVLIFPYTFQLEEFSKLTKGFYNDDRGLTIHLKDGYAAIWMAEICDYFGIDIDKVFVNK